jgi:CBS domain-containing protein
MLARDVMTPGVVTVSPETPVREIARVLLDHGISAVPVVDSLEAPVGIVSEGDLIGRTEADRLGRRDWWLELMANAAAPDANFLARAQRDEIRARDVMTAPVVTVGDTTDVTELARILSAYHIKRVPVLRDGRIVGIVSRADLLRALAAPPKVPAPSATPPNQGILQKAISALDEHFLHSHARNPAPPSEARTDARVEGGLSVADFRALVADHEHEEARKEDEKRQAEADQRQMAVRQLIDHHIGDEKWKAALHEARAAASRGEREFLVLRFPSSLCTDGGRAINAPQSDWPKTLRGEAAEIYLRWERELRPRGFHLSARVLDFPGGKPGDIGLFLSWGE